MPIATRANVEAGRTSYDFQSKFVAKDLFTKDWVAKEKSGSKAALYLECLSLPTEP